jgi:AcrR family transcriptional regulator
MARTPTPGRREALLAAGERVLQERGVEKATVTEIAREAGMAQGTFYLYFHSKGALVAALRQRFADQLTEVVLAQLVADASSDWFGRLRGLLDAAADAYLANAPLHEVVFHDTASDISDGEWHDAIVAKLAELIAAGRAAGAYEVGDPQVTALLLFCAIDGLFHHALHDPGTSQRERLVGGAWELVVRTLSGGESPANAHQLQTSGLRG